MKTASSKAAPSSLPTSILAARVARPGFNTLMAMEHLIELAVAGIDVLVEIGQREGDVLHEGRELARIDIGHRRIILGAVDRLPFHDVARFEQAHEIAQIADLLV